MLPCCPGFSDSGFFRIISHFPESFKTIRIFSDHFPFTDSFTTIQIFQIISHILDGFTTIQIYPDLLYVVCCIIVSYYSSRTLNTHYSQKNHCNNNCNDFSDYNDIIAPLDKLIMSFISLDAPCLGR